MSGKYTSTADVLFAQDQARQQDGSRELFKALLAQKRQQEAAASQQQSAQSHDMAKLAEADRIHQGQVESDMQRAQDLSKALGGKSAVHVGTASINPENANLGNAVAWANLKERQETRVDRQKREITDRLDKSGIPQGSQALGAVDASWKGGKAFGPIVNALPTPVQGAVANVSSRIGEFFDIDSLKGTGEEFQAVQRLMNIDTRQFTGANSTKFEVGRKLVEQGQSLGGSPEQVKQGIEMMREAYDNEIGNIEAGSNPEALAQVTKNYKVGSLRDLVKGPSAQAGDDRRKRLEELRAKAKKR